LLKVSDCVIKDIAIAKRGTPLKDIIKVFKERKFHVLPVVDETSGLVGKITLDEVVSVFQPHSAEITQLLKTIPFLDTVPEVDIDIDYITPEMGILVVADEIMTKNYFTIAPDDSIAKAFSAMKVNDTEYLMVVEEGSKLVGIVGMFDIIYEMFKEKGLVD
jgi:CBS domain-containing protein